MTHIISPRRFPHTPAQYFIAQNQTIMVNQAPKKRHFVRNDYHQACFAQCETEWAPSLMAEAPNPRTLVKDSLHKIASTQHNRHATPSQPIPEALLSLLSLHAAVASWLSSLDNNSDRYCQNIPLQWSLSNRVGISIPRKNRRIQSQGASERSLSL